MLRTKDTKKVINNILRALPAISAIPFLARKRSSSVLPMVLGAFGVAIAGGIAAVLVFSPRTRHRALDIAKDGYGKVRGQIDHLGLSEKLGVGGERSATAQPYSNGLVSEATEASYPGGGV